MRISCISAVNWLHLPPSRSPTPAPPLSLWPLRPFQVLCLLPLYLNPSFFFLNSFYITNTLPASISPSPNPPLSTPQKQQSLPWGVYKAYHIKLRQDQALPSYIKASHHREWALESQLRELQINLLQGPAFPLLVIYSKNGQSYPRTCSNMLIVSTIHNNQNPETT